MIRHGGVRMCGLKRDAHMRFDIREVVKAFNRYKRHVVNQALPGRRPLTVKDLVYLVEVAQDKDPTAKSRYGVSYVQPTRGNDPAFNFDEEIRGDGEPTYIFAHQGWTVKAATTLPECRPLA